MMDNHVAAIVKNLLESWQGQQDCCAHKQPDDFFSGAELDYIHIYIEGAISALEQILQAIDQER